MISVYFACPDCQIYIDCGGRWAYWELEEPKIVVRNRPAEIEAVLKAEQYWNPPRTDETRWLHEEVFPPLRTFLRDHSDHEVVFCDEDYVTPDIDERYLDWLQVGYRHLSVRVILSRSLVSRIGNRFASTSKR